ncbi:hypothetical protein EDB89DRAFT_1904492 [Lactarius sanguifluus]|nr:hypothetical protein EDB89DRAFT_1904492 [Lactarius sanguifluus]
MGTVLQQVRYHGWQSCGNLRGGTQCKLVKISSVETGARTEGFGSGARCARMPVAHLGIGNSCYPRSDVCDMGGRPLLKIKARGECTWRLLQAQEQCQQKHLPDLQVPNATYAEIPALPRKNASRTQDVATLPTPRGSLRPACGCRLILGADSSVVKSCESVRSKSGFALPGAPAQRYISSQFRLVPDDESSGLQVPPIHEHQVKDSDKYKCGGDDNIAAQRPVEGANSVSTVYSNVFKTRKRPHMCNFCDSMYGRRNQVQDISEVTQENPNYTRQQR